MTAERTKDDTQSFSCDECPETWEASLGFADAWAAAKRAGWRATKTREGWEHSCPECSS